MADIHLRYINAVHMKVVAEPGIIMELSERLTFFAPNYQFHPKFKARFWDGKIRILNNLTGVVYSGLAKRIKRFADEQGYTMSFDPQFKYENITEDDVKAFISTLHVPAEYERRDYQIDSIVKCLTSGKRTLISPTSSGKSFMIYIVARWYADKKTLLIVPRTGLVEQMASDFREYGYQGKIHKSTEGLSKSNDVDADIVITTWQSLDNGRTKMPKQWYQQFGVVFGDECHEASAACMVRIMCNLENCTHRFGTTGTMPSGSLTEASVEGLFGPRYKAVSTKELMDMGYVAKLKIKCIVLKYPKEVCKENKKKQDDIKKTTAPGKRGSKFYNAELDLILYNEKRMNFITRLIASLKGNKLVFFRYIDHGKALHEKITERITDNVFYIDGGVKDRELIRKSIEDEENATLIASLGTTSTGISIKKLHHMIAAAPQKSETKVPQSIGRMLRKHKQKEKAVLYDIVDDLSYGSYKNYALKHFEERIRMYDAEQFDYDINVIEF
jgi:superfamily II DNA or RNA helicase